MEDIKRLVKGFKRFRKNYFKSDDALFDELRHGQKPKVLLIGCSDSRVDPAILTDCQPGDLFVVRNVANLIPPYEPDARCHGVSSAIEYAVRFLEVEHIIVMGHAHCGGIEVLLRSDEETAIGEFIDHWVEIMRPAKEIVLRDLSNKTFEMQARACEQASIMISLENLLTFPWLAERVQAETLALHGWYFDMDGGQMLAYHPDTGEFEKLMEK